MENNLKSWNRIIKGMYFCGLLGMLLIIICICIGKDTKNIQKSYEFENTEQYWHLSKQGTETIDFTKLGSYMDEEKGVLSLYYKVPELKEKQTLMYRSKDVYTKVFVDGQQIYETQVYDSPFYNRSPGNLWNQVDIEQSCAGKYLELKVYMVYDVNAITIDNLFFGNAADIIHSMVSEKLLALFFSILMIFIGIMMIFMQMVPVLHQNNKNPGILYLGLYGLLMGIWSLLETNILQFYVNDERILQLANNMVMVVDSIPLLFYLDYYYNLLKRPLIKICACLQVVYILTCVVMQFSGIMDLHDLLKGAWICTFVNNGLLFACAFYFLYRFIRMKKIDKQVALQLLGIIALVVTTIISVMNYTQVDSMDRAQFLRFGMVIFILCFGISSQLQTYRLMEQGLKYDIVKDLAYVDGLTGVGNRTAYLEKLESMEKQKEELSLGIVFLDINNLKTTNDQLGHEQGDNLICMAANIVQNTYGRQGKVFRIGGDEFCVLMEGENIEKRYQKATEEFYCTIDEINKKKVLPAMIQIAQGFSVCKDKRAEEMNKAIVRADERMYMDKTRLKEEEKEKTS